MELILNSVELPLSWGQVTIERGIKAYAVQTSSIIDDVIERDMRLIAALSGASLKDVEGLQVDEIKKLSKQLEFTKQLPSERLPLEFKINDRQYKGMMDCRKMKGRQFADYTLACKESQGADAIYNMHKFMATFCVPIDTGYVGYDKEEDNIYKHMTMDLAYPWFVFFCQVAKRLYPYTQTYFLQKARNELKMVKKLLKKSETPSLKSTAGISYLI